ncbi:MAG: radical SAM protein [Thermodesulfobacteriota bacterium]
MEYVERTSSDRFDLWSKRPLLLGQLDIELTERCNNKCIHCCINLPAGDSSARDKELSTSELQRILTEAAALGTLEVRFTGGEPLLRPDFEELYLFARRLGLKVLLFTNGRLITPQLADLFAKIPPLVPIEITVYGMRPKSYEGVSSVRGSFAQFERGMKLLRERNVPFIVKGALLPPNRHEIAELETFALQLPWMDLPPEYAVFLEKRSRHDDSEKDRAIEAMRPSVEDCVAVLTRHPELSRKELTKFCRTFLGPPGGLLFPCGAGHAACVDAYGRLQPCLALRAPELTYDLLRGSLEHALKHFFPRVRELAATNPEYLKRCARCFLKSMCEQCPARSWNENSTLDTPVRYLCSLAHAQARWVGLLGSQEYGWEVQDWQSRIGIAGRSG